MFCRNCGKELTGIPEICMGCGARPLAGNSFCNACGAETNPLAEICIKCGTRLSKPTKATAAAVTGDISPKSRLVTTLLAILFVGQFGAHRFYTGKIETAIVMLVVGISGWVLDALPIPFVGWLGTACHWAVWIWAFIDFIYAVLGKFTDADGKLIENWGV